MDRRTCLKAMTGAVVVAATPLVRVASAQTGVAHRAWTVPPVVLYDARHATSRAFADALAHLDGEAIALHRDVMAQWRNGLIQRVQAGQAVVGLSLGAERFVHTQVALDAGLRVLCTGDHDFRQPDRSVHTLSGFGTLSAVTDGLAVGADWVVGLAAGLAALSPASGVRNTARVMRAEPVSIAVRRADPLSWASWVIGGPGPAAGENPMA